MRLAERISERVSGQMRELRAVSFAMSDPKVPLLPKALGFLALAYALSPIDLIPDFIPVLGYLDDIVIVPALLFAAKQLIPAEAMERARNRAAAEWADAHSQKRAEIAGAILISAIWLLVIWLVLRRFLWK